MNEWRALCEWSVVCRKAVKSPSVRIELPTWQRQLSH